MLVTVIEKKYVFGSYFDILISIRRNNIEDMMIDYRDRRPPEIWHVRDARGPRLLHRFLLLRSAFLLVFHLP